MPWRGPNEPGEFPTLGYLVADWIEAHCVIPDGVHMGDPFVLTDEQLAFLLWHYRLRPDARPDPAKPSRPFVYRRSQLVRPQKWGKGPFSASMICAEADGPVLFDGWDTNGDPVGRPWHTPWIQVTAVSEDQTDNVWRALLPMIELGALNADLDTGLTRINLPGGGFIEPVTASARSRLGQRLTFAVQDETHSWTERNGGIRLADNQRRNLAGMGGRSIETTNAWDPAEGSVAQLTYESSSVDIHKDFPQASKAWSYKNKRERARIHRFGYQGAPWVDLDRIEAEALELLPRDPAQAERFFGNRIVSGSDQAFDVDRWKALANPSKRIRRGEMIVIGVDGARYEDALGVVATHVRSGHQWVLGVWERPEFAPEGYEHPFEDVDVVMVDAFERWEPWRVYIDPQRIELLVDRWKGRWGDQIIEWRTDRVRPIALALRAYRAAMQSGDFSHDGDEGFARHIGNARRRTVNVRDDEGRPLWSIEKDRPGSPRKIDLAMAGCLSWEARGDAIAAGALTAKKPAGRLVTFT